MSDPSTIAPAREAAAGPVAFGWLRAAAQGLRFRRQTESDLSFLHRLYASTRAQELAILPWSAAQKAAFLESQFHAQQTHYQTCHPGTDWLVAVHDGTEVGRLYLERCPTQHRIIDIAFLTEHRGKGFGAALLRDVMDEAAAAGRSVSTHVEKFSPAMRLYRRLGFEPIEDEGVYELMRWNP